MSFARVDGLQLLAMLHSGLQYLTSKTEYINDLNVFPVADGDTGTNMSRTLESGIKNATRTAHVGQLLKGVSDGMLFGARGNSGVILSQFFRGMYQELSRKDLLGPGELRNGLIAGYKMAYQAVARPVEGTILTVARQGIENIRSQITRKSPIDTILSMYIAEMKKTLSFTPELLPVLKESGVVDSGAYGFICIFEGMLAYLFGEVTAPAAQTKGETQSLSTDFLDAQSEFTEGYCLEFILRLLKTGKYNQHFDLNKFTDDLQVYGTSVIAVQEDTLVKVHIHTAHLSRTISLCEEYGVFLDFKVDNLQLQKNAQQQKATEKKRIPFGKIAVADGAGICEMYRQLGCDTVLTEQAEGGLSTSDFYRAAMELNAARVVILPNNKNAILSAEQAKKMLAEQKIQATVIPTENPVEGYFCLALDIPDMEACDKRIASMSRYKEGLTVLSATTAQKQGCFDGVCCEIGDCICLLDGKLAAGAKTWEDSICAAVSAVADLEDKASCVIFYGKDAPQAQREALEARLGEAFPDLEPETFEGGQSVYFLRMALV